MSAFMSGVCVLVLVICLAVAAIGFYLSDGGPEFDFGARIASQRITTIGSRMTVVGIVGLVIMALVLLVFHSPFN